MSHNLMVESLGSYRATTAAVSDGKSLRILHVDNVISETCASYNEHVLAKIDDYWLTVCTYFDSTIKVPPSINVYAGKGSLRSFYRQFFAALRNDDFDIIHIHAPLVGFLVLLGLLICYPARLRSTVYTVHSAYQNYSHFHRLLLLPMFAVFRRIVHCSWSSYESFPMLYQWLAGSDRTAIPNGVDVHRVDNIINNLDPNSGKAPGSEFKLLAIGRLILIRNPFVLLNSVARTKLPNLRLDFLGDGLLGGSLMMAADYHSARVQTTLRGVIPRHDVYKALAEADLFISTSLCEGLPIAVMEAMCCGCPVILSDIPSHRELVKDVNFIPLVGTTDMEGLSQEIRKIHAMGRKERRLLGKKCRSLVEERLSLDIMHKGYAKVYYSVAKHSPQSKKI